MTVSVQKEMSNDPPRRIVALPSEVHIPLRPIIRSGKSLSKPRSIAPCTRASRRKSVARLNFFGKGSDASRVLVSASRETIFSRRLIAVCSVVRRKNSRSLDALAQHDETCSYPERATACNRARRLRAKTVARI